jgi:ABC-type thiamine transport system ATPase subunit
MYVWQVREAVAVMGASGSGKSTLLNLVAGLFLGLGAVALLVGAVGVANIMVISTRADGGYR